MNPSDGDGADAPIISLIQLDRQTGQALPEQIYHQLRSALMKGACPAGSKLPSSRQIAQHLGVSRNTAITAYDLLLAEGLITVTSGAAPVAALIDRISGARDCSDEPFRLSPRGQRLAHDRHLAAYATREGFLRPGHPDPDLFPHDLWARLLRRAVRTLGHEHELYAHAQGLPALREALVRYLGQTRGLTAAPQDVLILPTTQAGLAMLGQALCEEGDTVWVEDPGYGGVRSALAGGAFDPMPVDDQGADPSLLVSHPRLICVSPSHQYPTGQRMSVARRQMLLARARAENAIIVEDDYDSEFLWQGRPVPALQALSQDGRVVYIGTLAKSLLPGLRLAYMVAPEGLAAALALIQRNCGVLVNIHTQAAFADFLGNGHYRAHLAHIRAIYAERSGLLTAALARHCAGLAQVGPVHGGLQLLVEWTSTQDDRKVAANLGKAGFAVQILSSMCHRQHRRGLVVGFAKATADQANHFGRALRRELC